MVAEQYALYGLTRASGPVFLARLTGWLSGMLALLTVFLLAFLVMLFPDGRLPSRRWRPLLWVMLLVVVGGVAAQLQHGATIDGGFTNVLSAAGVSYPNPVAIFPRHGWFSVLLAVIFVLAVAVLVLTVASVFARRSGASPERRKQLAWLGYVGLVTAMWAAVLITGGLLTRGANSWIGTLLWTFLTLTPVAGIPLACVVAVTKYRLYEIDRLISRTVAYAIVTGLLIGVYAGLVLFATHALPLRGPVAVAGSTLIAAALFSPLRQRVQKIVDRRFNRSRYDAEQMIVAFAARLQDATDPDAVRTDLIAAASQALEPAHVSLWSGAGQR
jgi:MFS family permease